MLPTGMSARLLMKRVGKLGCLSHCFTPVGPGWSGMCLLLATVRSCQFGGIGYCAALFAVLKHGKKKKMPARLV